MRKRIAPPTTKQTVESLAKFRGDQTVVLKHEIDELDASLNDRLDQREKLEGEIAGKQKEFDMLKESVSDLEDEESDLFDQVEKLAGELQTMRSEKSQLTKDISRLQKLRDERDRLAKSVKDLTKDESELDVSIRTKKTELRSLELKAAPIREKQADIARRERQVKEDAEANAKERTELNRDREALEIDRAANQETLRNIELGGKSIGHYVRGLQRHLDGMGVKIDILDLLGKL